MHDFLHKRLSRRTKHRNVIPSAAQRNRGIPTVVSSGAFANCDGGSFDTSRPFDFGLRPSLKVTEDGKWNNCKSCIVNCELYGHSERSRKRSRGISTIHGAHHSVAARLSIPDRPGVLRRRRAVRSHPGRRTAINLVLRWLRTAGMFRKGECSAKSGCFDCGPKGPPLNMTAKRLNNCAS